MLAAQRGGGFSNWKSNQSAGRRSRASSGSGSHIEDFEKPLSSGFESDEEPATESAIQGTDDESDDKDNCAKRIIDDPRFTMIVAFAIMSNVFIMTLQVNNPDVDISWGCQDGACWNLWNVIDRVFLIFFSVELALRLWGHGCRVFFCDSGEDLGWNIFDFFVVATCWIIWLFQSVDFKGGRFVKLLRSARMLRILRVLRIFRLPCMKKLNIIVAGLVHSFSVVSWIALMLGGVMFICAIICTEMIGNHAHDWGEDDQDEIRLLFGSMSNSTITLFNFLTLADWSGVTRLVAKKEPSMTFFFLAYVIFAAMVILSLLTGVLADHMNTVREAEEREEEELRFKERTAALKAELRAFQRAAQKTPRGVRKGNAPPNTIGMAQFKEILRDPSVKEELEDRGVKISDFDPDDLFECFDSTGSSAISWNDFRQGMEELRIGVMPRQIFKLEVSLRRAVKECRSESAAVRPGTAAVGSRQGSPGGPSVLSGHGAGGGTRVLGDADVDLLSLSSSSAAAMPKVEASARLAQLSARSSNAAKHLGEFAAELRAFDVSDSLSRLASVDGSDDDEDSIDSVH